MRIRAAQEERGMALTARAVKLIKSEEQEISYQQWKIQLEKRQIPGIRIREAILPKFGVD